jgi:hypothetical protein
MPSPIKKSKAEDIPVKECECADCQYMKDKPRVEYGPKMFDYKEMFPVSLK